ncbi:MAG TPA: gephyrin-like molybdotransferase Glp [Vicinamibacterales bacterium]|nr:gephyrin-like molybdotransferase Glp [Vicinamibacterales bacterium]
MTTRMRPFQKTIPLDEARAIIDRALRPIDRVERLPLHQANGRVLARDVTSDADVPPFSRAAMDGYAVRADDTTGASRTEPRTLQCIEKVFTGQLPLQAVGPGQCTEIATGAPMPAGADAVVMVEDTASADETIRIFATATPRQNIGRQGADIQKGQLVLPSGTALNASRVGALAALGSTDVEVFARPRVAILSTGNEIAEPGQPLAPGQIYDINRFTVAAVVSDNGGIPVPYRTAVDTLEDLSRAVDECLEQDVLVFSGGSSVGERDLILDVIAAKGEVLFHGIAVKPGKPTAFGRIAGKLVFGMPGYPTSCLSNAYILLAPSLRRMARLPDQIVRSLTLPLAARVVSAPGRHQFYTVRIEYGVAVPAFKASGDITSMSRADGYIEIPADVDVVEEGSLVEVKLF